MEVPVANNELDGTGYCRMWNNFQRYCSTRFGALLLPHAFGSCLTAADEAQSPVS
jgi:hypothetical protein